MFAWSGTGNFVKVSNERKEEFEIEELPATNKEFIKFQPSSSEFEVISKADARKLIKVCLIFNMANI